MINGRAEGSAAQTPLTCREVVQVLRDVVFGRLEMTRAGERSWHEMNAGLFLVHVGSWTLAIYNDAEEIDYCQWCLDPSGRRWSFDSSSRLGGDPIELLSTWEHSELQHILKAL